MMIFMLLFKMKMSNKLLKNKITPSQFLDNLTEFFISFEDLSKEELEE